MGDLFRAISVVRSGAVKTFTAAPSGERQITGFYLPGELLGFDGVADDVHICSAKVLETTSVCQLPFNELEEISLKLPGLQRQLHRIMGRELIEEQHMLLQIGKMHAKQRLAAFLLNYSIRLQSRGYSASEFNLTISRTDIGNYLGLTVETISRLFSKLQQDNIIATDKKLVTLKDPEALMRFSGISITNRFP